MTGLLIVAFVLGTAGFFFVVMHDADHLPWEPYWMPLSAPQRAHNRKLAARKEAEALRRRASDCRALAKEYREDGDEMAAIVLDVEADDAERQFGLRVQDSEIARKELREVKYRELTGGER